MADIHFLRGLVESGQPPLPPGGEPPDNGNVELAERIEAVETDVRDVRDRLGRVETKLDGLATKAEMHDLKAELIKWTVGTAFGLGSVAIVVMTFVLNNAVPKAAPAIPPAPIVITLPAQPAPAATSPAPNSSARR